MKKTFRRIVATLLCAFMLTSIGCKPQPKLTISDSTLTMSLFEEKTISVDTDILGEITWTSSNEQVVVLTADGDSANLLAIGAGSSDVVAKVGDKSVTCKVTVAESEDALELNVSSSKDLVINKGSTSQIASAVTFKDADFAKASVSYSIVTEDAGCITVSESGLISAVSAGTATVKAIASYYGNYSNEVSINVIVLPDVTVSVEPAEVNLVYGSEDYVSEIEVVANQSVDGAAAVPVEVASFSVVDNSVATFEDGKIKALGVGSTVITLSFEYNEYLTIDKEISVNVASAPVVTMTADAITVDMRDLRGDVDAVVYEDNATISASVVVNEVEVENPAITYTVKDGSESIISVSGNVVTGLAKGEGVVVASYTDAYGGVHNLEIDVTVNGNIYYGQHAKYAVNALVADIPRHSSLYIEDVALTDSSTSLISVQYIPKDTYNGDWCSGTTANGADSSVMAPGNKMFFVTIVDAEDASNYITIGLRQSYDNWYDPTHIVYIGARASVWGEFNAGSGTAEDFYSATGSMGVNGGYGLSTQFSMYGRYLDNSHHCAVPCYTACDTDADYLNNYQDYMLNLSVVGTKVYYQRAYKNTDVHTVEWTELVDLGAVTGKTSWTGFTSSKVNILIDADNCTNGYTSEFSVAIATLGGQAVSAASVNDNIYYCRNFSSIKVGALYPKGWTPEA